MDSTGRLLHEARGGDSTAIRELFARHLPGLRRWARGRLPQWVRQGVDTTDLVQDAIAATFRRLTRFEPRHAGALRAYLRRAVMNGVRDEVRRAKARAATSDIDLDGVPSQSPSPFETASEAETEQAFARGLARLRSADRAAIVGRLRLEYSYEQLALALGKPSPDAARMAVARALLRLASEMARDCGAATT